VNICALCKKEITLDKFFSRKSLCPHCGHDLHICLNCRFYSDTSHNKCLEPRAEYQRTRDKANFCDYFQFAHGRRASAKGGGPDPAEEARRKLRELFKD
jgi:predicted RNA-binding Zn-ribbon protein involved in translation (DUF1610 family)